MLWWLSKTTEPQADNRRVLRPYSQSMRRLLRDGYEAAMRPSQHDIGPHFRRDNGGAIPPNLLTVPNTPLERRLPPPLPGGRAADPPGPVPAGGAGVLHPLPDRAGPARARPVRRQQRHRPRRREPGRNWISIELNGDYVTGSRSRFAHHPPRRQCDVALFVGIVTDFRSIRDGSQAEWSSSFWATAERRCLCRGHHGRNSRPSFAS